MDSRKVKRFIAKEGLILFGTIGLGLLFQTFGTNLLPSLQVAVQQSQGRFISDGSPVPKTYTETDIVAMEAQTNSDPNSSINDGPWNKYKSNTAVTEQGSWNDYKPSDGDWVDVNTRQFPKQNCFNKVMILLGKLLIICYPIFWIIRFIVWAVRTLKQKD